MSCHEPIKAHGSLVACAYCPDCRSRRSAIWAVRLEDEEKQWDRSCFLTLTISDACIGLPDAPSPSRLRRRDLQLFFKRLRKGGFRFKYYAVGEYGERSARAHYHILLFGLDRRDRVDIEKAWPFGIVDIGSLEPASVRYVTGYVMKAPLGRLRLHAERIGSGPAFSVMSHRLGFAGAHARRHTITTQGVIRIGSKAVPPPRYYVSQLDEKDKAAFLSARRDRQLQRGLDRLNQGQDFVKNNVLDRAIVSRVDFKAREKPRGRL